ncbi:MAG: TM2 domain-containing protein [Thermoguttaceae bacterium]|nr:TM2 domain-containing protein [Thermoguttaceae bacterium]
MDDTNSTTNTTSTPSVEQPEIDLKNPFLAALLTFVLPGAGHFYQGRIGKGIVFCVCVLGLFIYGLVLSSGDVGWGRAMYWKWTSDDHRFYFLGQVCIGAPALPALIQSKRAKNGEDPLLYGFMAPPISSRYVVNNHGKLEYANLSAESLAEQNSKYNYTFHQIRKSLNKDFELGTLFTTIAGLLNLLVVFDAAGGIVIETEDKKKKKAAGSRQ